MNYYVTSINDRYVDNIIRRIKELGIKVYNYYNCIPTKVITLTKDIDDFESGTRFIYFKNNNDYEIEYMNILGFGFQGLYEDDEKVNEVEEFGKYKCRIYTDDDICISSEYISETEFEF